MIYYAPANKPVYSYISKKLRSLHRQFNVHLHYQVSSQIISFILPFHKDLFTYLVLHSEAILSIYLNIIVSMKIIFILLFILFSTAVFSQQIIRGNILDKTNGEPLQYAVISQGGRGTAVISDKEGYFQLTIQVFS